MQRYFGFGKVLILIAAAFAYLLFFAPWNKGTVAVTGTAKLEQAPQIATFYATVSISDDDKNKAVNEVNTRMTSLISSLKSLGIADVDIQTSQVNVRENTSEIMIYPPRGIPAKKWQVANSITIKLRDTAKASELTDLLNNSGATGVSGPNFAIDDTKQSDAELLAKAIADAKTKASAIAKAGGRNLGKMVTVTEGGNVYPLPLTTGALRESSAPIQPGTETLSKSVTVVFELQ